MALQGVASCTDDGKGHHRARPGDAAAGDHDSFDPACGNLPTLPVTFRELPGFTQAEDFAFDSQGRVVSVDNEGSLVRHTKDGSLMPWVPGIGADVAGIRYLPNGDLLVNAVATGSLLRVTPAGGYTTVLAGLVYPNGIDVDAEGYVYVSEHDAGRVRRINPDTGDFTIIATRLLNPNGLVFGNGYKTLYVGSFMGGTIHAIERNPDGSWAPPRLFARSPLGPVDECATLSPEDPCTTVIGTEGRCAVVAELPECKPISACDGKHDGEACDTWGTSGVCTDVGGVIECMVPDPCDGKVAGDACELEFEVGQCVESGGTLSCEFVGPCTDKAEGEACDNYGLPGICQMTVWGLECVEPAACDGKQAGDACDFYGMPGTCIDIDGALTCVEPLPCSGKLAGDGCSVWGNSGFCVTSTGGLLCDLDGPCLHKQPDDACDYYGQVGVCTDFGGYLDCAVPDPCEGKAMGDTCDTGDGLGICVGEAGALYCTLPEPCDGKPSGADCELDGNPGVCLSSMGYSECVDLTPCQDKVEGDLCLYWGYDGTCENYDGHLLCVSSGSEGEHGGLDGIGVDICGNVYVTEYTVGKVWRFPPEGSLDGSAAQLVFKPHSSWIPNIHWGIGRGGFELDKMYIADRDEGRLFEADVGVRGRPVVFPTEAP